MAKKNKGGRPRIQHNRFYLELPDDLMNEIDTTGNKIAVATVIGKVLSAVAVDASLLGLGYYLGAEHGLSLPGGPLWTVVGIPDFSELRKRRQKELWAAEDIWRATEKLWDDAVADPDRYPVIRPSDCDPEDERRCTTIPNYEKHKALYDGAVEAFNKAKQLQGLLYAIFIYVIAKHLGGIAQGIGQIVPG